MFDVSEIQRQAGAVKTGDDAARRKAVNFLKDVAAPDWADVPAEDVRALVPALRAYLTDELAAAPVRRSTVMILEHIGARSAPAIPELVALLDAKHPPTLRDAAAAALGRVGPGAKEATDALADRLTDNSTSLVLIAVRALGAMGRADDRVRAALLDLWRSRSNPQGLYVILAAALRQLGISDRMVVPYLTTALMTGMDSTIRMAAGETLVLFGKDEPDVVPALLRATLGDKDERVRIAAKEFLDRLRLPRGGAVAACAEQLADSAHAETALRLSGAEAVPGLVIILAQGTPTGREKAARILGRLGEAGQDAAPALTKALRDADPSVRLAAAKSLWGVSKNATAATPVLVRLLATDWPPGDEAVENRRRALQNVIEALRDIGPPAAGATRASQPAEPSPTSRPRC
jgi:HEAT repeat protein